MKRAHCALAAGAGEQSFRPQLRNCWPLLRVDLDVAPAEQRRGAGGVRGERLIVVNDGLRDLVPDSDPELVTRARLAGCVSSLTMVPTPWPSAMVALTGVSRLTKKVSVGSNLVSPTTCTVTVWLVSPGAKMTVPLVAA